MQPETIDIPHDASKDKSFLQALNYQLITISVRPEAENAIVPRGKWFSVKNKTRAVPFNVYLSAEFQEELLTCQINGCAVFFMINEGNGSPKDLSTGQLGCARNENVTILKTLAIDSDGADYAVIKEKIEKIGLTPHYTVESSPDRYHLYFLIEPEEAEGENLSKWKTIQTFLASLDDKFDSSLSKQCQLLRVPGFLNLKPHNKRFKVRIKETNNIPKHNLDTLYTKFQGENFEDILNESAGYTYTNGEIKPKYIEPEGYLPEGGRRKGITHYMESVMENKVKLDADEEIYFAIMDARIKKKIRPEEQYLFLEEGQERRENLKQYVRDQIKWRHKKSTHLENIIEHHENVVKEAMPDKFYLDFPGDLGLLTRELHDYAPFISLEMCFAGALIISGMMKGDHFRYDGSWPYINGFIIAGSGAGKSSLKTVIEKTLKIAGFKGKYPKLIPAQTSVQSLHEFLYTAGGAGTIIVDEAGEHLQSITAKNAHMSAKAMRSYYKNASTARYDGVTLHPGFSLGFKAPELIGGLAIWMMIQPGVFEKTLSTDDMEDGFLPRFFIFNGQSNLNISEKAFKPGPFIPSPDLMCLMESLNPANSRNDFKATEEEVDKEITDKKLKLKSEEIRRKKSDAIYEKRFQTRCMGKIDVEITKEALRLVEARHLFMDRELKNVVALEGEDAPSLPVYQRVVEMLNRLMCNACEYKDGKAVITEEIAKNCIEFQKFQLIRFFSKELRELNKSKIDKEEDKLKKAIRKAYKEKGNKLVSYSEILRCVSAKDRNATTRKILNDLVMAKEVWCVERPHKKASIKKVKEYRLAAME